MAMIITSRTASHYATRIGQSPKILLVAMITSDLFSHNIAYKSRSHGCLLEASTLVFIQPSGGDFIQALLHPSSLNSLNICLTIMPNNT